MKKLIYFGSVIIIALICVLPNLKVFQVNINSYKENLPVTPQATTNDDSKARSLPSFLESSTGVNDTTELLGSADPTVAVAKTKSLSEAGITNDEEIYGITLAEDVKKSLIESSSSSADKNAKLSDTVFNNSTDSSEKSTNVDIKILKSLAEFCAMS